MKTPRSLLFMRHARTSWNINGLTMGQTDPPLSEMGQSEASDAIDLLSAHVIDTVVSSSLQRCLATAAPFCDKFGYKVLVMPQLAERAWGSFEGLPKFERCLGSRQEGGETDEQFSDRIHRAINELPGRGYTLVVAHSGVFRELIRFGYAAPSLLTQIPHAVPIPLTKLD